MPTILINTNLKNASNDSEKTTNGSGGGGGDDLDDEFRQDINTIITKLLNKSKTIDSFTIKYDIDDINLKTKQTIDNDIDTNQNLRTNCICHKMARLFNDILQPSSSHNETTSTTPTINDTQTDLRHIYKEIKLLRKYQFDLNNKFNLLIDKLDGQPAITTNKQIQQTPSTNTSPCNNNSKILKQEPKVHLTGAKKRKFNSFKSFNTTSTVAQDPPRSASVTSSSSSDSSTSSSHTSTSTEIQQENESLIMLNDNQDESNGDLGELDEVYQDDMDEYDNYDEQKCFKYPQQPLQIFPRQHNFKFQPQSYNFNPPIQLPQTQTTPQKSVLSSNLNQSYDLDLNELFKGNGPKYLQLESYKNFKPPIVSQNEKYFVDDTMAALSYSKSKSRRNFAAHLTKLVFTPRERLESNCNGRFGKKALDSIRLLAIRNTIFKYYPCKQSTVILNGDKITSGDYDENSVWVRDCIPAIDESNRVLKKQLVAWYKKNNPSILIRHNGGGGGGSGNGSGQQVQTQGLSPSTSNTLNYNYYPANVDECNEGFEEVDEC